MKKKYLTMKVDTNLLLREIVDSGLVKNAGVLKIPLNVFRIYLVKVAERCAEINDPVLDKLMCNMSLYEEATKGSKDYNPEMIEQVERNYQEFLKSKNLTNQNNERN